MLERVKPCSKCKAVKPFSEFGKCSARKIGIRPACKACDHIKVREWQKANRDYKNLKTKQWLDAHPESYAMYQVRKRAKLYGLSVQELADLYEKHNSSCAICFEPEKPKKMLHIDHCHTTGTVRGLLCFACNIMLGKAKDCTERLGRAIAYLANSEKVS